MNYIEIAGAAIGLAYIMSEYRADRWFWPLSLVMSVFYIVIDFSSGIFANGVICCYNFVMSVYGLLVWRGVVQSREKKERPITSCPARYWPWIVVAVAVLTVAMQWVLGRMDESRYPWVDGLSAALSIVAMWMLAQKWWQQWLCWLVVEPMMTALFWMTGNYASAVLYVVYEVFCIFGIIRWRRQAVKSST